jgi:cysteine desulfurase
MKGIYLDNSMTARPSSQAVSSQMPFFSQMWGNPAAPHRFGQELYPSIDDSYRAIYRMLGASEQDNFVFTSSGAEAVNQVIWNAYYDSAISHGKNQFITSTIEEAPQFMAISRLSHLGCVPKFVPVDQHGKITVAALEQLLTPRTALVSFSWVNGLTGVVQPIAEISQICHERGVPLHLDITHALGKLFFEIEDLGASFITFNGDNLHAPKGTGGCWIRNGVKCVSLIAGGLEQGGRRAGCLNVPGLVALGCAADEIMDSRNLMCTEIARLRNQLENGITAACPGAIPFFKGQERVPHITAVGFPGIANESLLYLLNRKGVYASIGGGSFQQIALVLGGAGIDPALAQSAISFSLSRETTEEEIDKAIEIIQECVKKLKQLSEAIE